MSTLTPEEWQRANSKRIAAGICGILLGGFGVHKFILEMTTPAVIMLVVSLVSVSTSMFCIPVFAYGAMHIIGLVEGIIYLTKTDEEFYHTYMVGKKEWF